MYVVKLIRIFFGSCTPSPVFLFNGYLLLGLFFINVDVGRERLGEFDLWKWDWKKVSLWIRDSFLVGRKSERKCRSQVSCERLSDRSLWKIENVCLYWITRRSASVPLWAICKSNDWRSLWSIAGKIGRLCVCWVVKNSLVRIIFGQLRSVGWGLFDSLASRGDRSYLAFRSGDRQLTCVTWEQLYN